MTKELDKIMTKLKKDYSDSLPDVNEAGVIKRLLLSSPQMNFILSGGFPIGRIIEFFGPESGGKEQPHSSKVLTPSGWVTMGEIKVGDEVCTPSGRISKVTGKFPQGSKDIYKITLQDGSSTLAGLEHLWEVTKGDAIRCKKRKSGKIYIDSGTRIVTTGDLLNLQKKHYSKYNKLKSPRGFYLTMIKPQQFSTKDLPVPPYALGLLLGDGGLTQGTTTFSTADSELIESLTTLLVCEVSQVNDYDYRLKTKGDLPRILESLNLQGTNSYTKFIPEAYKWSSIEDRLNLLRGLLDTDGYVTHHSIEYSSSSSKLAQDVVDIVHGLGGTARIKIKETSYTYNGEKKKGALSYRVHLSLPFELGAPFKLSRKVKEWGLRSPRKHNRQLITSVEYSHVEEASCIMIDDADHLYITDNFIPTHNTVISSYIAGEVQRRKDGGPSTVLFIDMEYAFDKNYAEVVGLDCSDDKFIFVRPLNGEEAFTIVEDLVQTGEIGLVIWDSVASTSSIAEMDKDYGAANFGKSAALFSQGLRKLNPYLSRFGTSMILLNQVRANIGGYAMPGMKPESTPGGYAVKFFSSWRARVSKMEDIAVSRTVVGNVIKIRNVKNKIGVPKRSAVLELKYETGFDPDGEYIQFIIDLGIVRAAGAWITSEEWGIKLQGREKLLEWLKANPDKFEECKRIVNESFTKTTILDEGDVEVDPEDEE